MESLRRLFIFSRVLRPEKLEGAFLRGNVGILLILMNEHRLNQEILMNTGQFKKICGRTSLEEPL